MFRLVCFHVRDGAGFPAPGVVDEDFRVHPEQLVEQFLIAVFIRFPNGAPGDVSHGVHPVGLQLVSVSLAHPPEVGKGPVGPQLLPVTHLVQLGNAHPVLIRLDVLGPDVHGDLGQIQVGAHARRGGDAGGLEDVQDDGPGQLPGRHLVGVQIVGQIHEHLVNRVGEDVLRGHILQIDAVDFCAPVNVVGHPGRGHNVVKGQSGVAPHLRIVPGGAGELMARGVPLAPGVHLRHPLYHLEEPGPASDAISL